MKKDPTDLRPVLWREDKLIIIDQTLLPGEERYIELKNTEEVVEAIKKLRVRGAPAIGVCAAYGLYVALRERMRAGRPADRAADAGTCFRQAFWETAAAIGAARPTAVNLRWAIARQEKVFTDAEKVGKDPEEILAALLTEAKTIHAEDEEACRRMGENGLTLLKPGMGILTHCNAGALATSRYGTCLSPIYLGEASGYGFHVYADETRPLLQGARLTAWELARAGVDVTLICDNMAQTVMRKGLIDAVCVGCDRMAANGDGANKIGTAAVAILAKEFGIPFYMFVPTSTIDLATKSGNEIQIEEREGAEIAEMWYNKPMAPAGIKTFNPAFDVTPAAYITAVVTERGIVRPPYGPGLKRIMEQYEL